MAPSPENDSTPKAPDKADPRAPENKSISSVGSLDDGQLKALLDEAITYKTPRDREGKSELFKTLLTDAEDEIRKDHARSASGPELARYYNTTANRRHRNKRQPSSISENLTHGGSLNDLAKEELYESASNLQRSKKTVSARQREGGSLPCNVNCGASYDKQFFLEEQAKRKTKIKEQVEYTAIEMESEMLLENDMLGQQYSCESDDVDMEMVPAVTPHSPNIFTSKATLQIGNVDECINFSSLERGEKNAASVTACDDSYKQLQDVAPHYNVMGNKWACSRSAILEEKKVDENGNALGQSSTDTKKRKKSGKRGNEVVVIAEDIAGHRADIISDIDMLVQYISGDKPKFKHKLQKHMSEDKGKNKQRTRSSKGTKSAGNHHHHLQKSNSMEEMSTMKLEDFHFDSLDSHGRTEGSKTALRPTKSNAEKPRERKPWVSELHASAENLESSDFTYVTKKKKSKKRRNSLGSRKQTHSSDVAASEFHQVPSPRRKSACSVPHSEKSNDSSDAESVHSLPIDDNETLNLPISYADIAKSADRPKWNRPPSERKKSVQSSPEQPPPPVVEPKSPVIVEPPSPPPAEIKTPPKESPLPLAVVPSPKIEDSPPPTNNKNDLSSLQNWPEIRNNKVNVVKNLESAQNWPTIQTNNGLKNFTISPESKLKGSPPQKLKTINSLKSPPKEELEPPPQLPIILNDTILNDTQQVIQKVSEQHQKLMYPYQMPPNIQDVQSIEQMHFQNLHRASYPNNGEVHSLEDLLPPPAVESEKRPAVVILSGADKHVSDITFGFDINEQLLSDDVCADFINRFYLPETSQLAHIEKIVHYIGSEWEEVMVQTSSGKVKYYSEDL